VNDDLDIRLRAAFGAELPAAPDDLVDLVDHLDDLVTPTPQRVGRPSVQAMAAVTAVAVVVAVAGLIVAPAVVLEWLGPPVAAPLATPGATPSPTPTPPAATLRPGSPLLVPGTVVRVDAASGEIVAAVPSRPRPGLLTVAGGFVWSVGFGDGSVSRIDPATGAVETLELGVEAASILGAGDEVWIAAGEHDLLRVDAATGRELGRLVLDARPLFRTRDAGFMALAGGSLWLTVPNLRIAGAPQEIWQVDPASGTVATRLEIGRDPQPPLLVGSSLFLVHPPLNRLTRIDTATGEVATMDLGSEPTWATEGAGSLWIGHGRDRSIWQVDPVTLEVMDRIDVGQPVQGLTWADGTLWVTTPTSLLAVDARSGEVDATIRLLADPVTHGPNAPVVLDGMLWLGIE
jgi:outer membrane protein assembly factor BamB